METTILKVENQASTVDKKIVELEKDITILRLQKEVVELKEKLTKFETSSKPPKQLDLDKYFKSKNIDSPYQALDEFPKFVLFRVDGETVKVVSVLNEKDELFIRDYKGTINDVLMGNSKPTASLIYSDVGVHYFLQINIDNYTVYLKSDLPKEILTIPDNVERASLSEKFIN